ncbi:TIGR03960 family B12-binding radical SAM protein, partial [bacterium]|nr:TIGR03960 family B12-binding radical SAM protein [bacterium]
MENLKNRVFTELLPFVMKPGRYTGNEFNTHPKNWGDVDLTFALIFPELYELGMSYVGFDILYHVLNKQPKIVAERAYAPDVDLEALLREKNIPLFSLENKMPLAAFDILGFTFQYELHATNILNILNLAQLPLYSRERDESHPLVVIGGPCAHNPEPMADFVDVVVLGDGEDIILELCQAVTTAKAQKHSREKLLRDLSQISGIYVPQFYQIQYQQSGEIKSIQPTIPEAPEVITARILDRLEPENYPEKPIVPLIPITHDRFSMEIMRGCTRGCRFCNAGMIYRPVRERPVDELYNYAKTVIEKTGYEEFSLVSLSSSDYTYITELLTRLSKFTKDKQVRLSLPSLRPETFSSQVAQHASNIKKSGLTLAPEAGTERLRRVINKTNSNADLLNAVKLAFENGWQLIKLYFMIGQPTETTEDLDGIVNLINDVVKLAKSFGGKKVNVSLSPFTPKAHTPFQWEHQNSLNEFREKVQYIRKQQKYRSLKISWRDPEVAFAEGVISRGDRRVGQVILNAWQNGAKFDAWTQYFSFETWQKAYDSAGIQPEFYHRQHEIDGLLPWQHLSLGITDAYLKLENQRAHRVEETDDCRLSGCNSCGLMEHPVCQTLQNPADILTPESTAPVPETAPEQPPRERTTSAEATHLRIKYAKGQTMRFLSHLDIIRIFERSFRRAGIP